MPVKITFRNTLVRGERMCKIVSFDGVLKEDELPKKYTNGDCAFWMVNSSPKLLRILGEKSGYRYVFNIEEGDDVEPEKRGWIVSTMQHAGNLLHEMNKEIRALRETWEGYEEVVTI